jgi:hypothetical protein
MVVVDLLHGIEEIDLLELRFEHGQLRERHESEELQLHHRVRSNYPKCPHHRAAAPNKECPATHILTGALVGGPDNNDQYQDDVNQYQYTEVAMDYNACLVAALAAQSGGNPPTYPTPTPTPEPGPTANPGTGDGLLGEYHMNNNFGTLVMSRIDKNIDFNWGGSAPDSALPSDSFSVRWTGQVEALYTDTYVFYENSDDGCRVYLDNNPIIDQWVDGAAAENASSAVPLNAGTKHAIKVEYYENGGDASCQLLWSSNYQAKEVVPQSRLYSGVVVTPVPTVEPTYEPTAIVTPAPTDTVTPEPTASPSGCTSIMGDYNLDGSVTITDALWAAQWYTGLLVSPPPGQPCADVNCDDSVNVVDALLIAQYYVGLIASFPCSG